METPEIVMLFDGECPLCMREVRMLQRADKGRGRLGFEDIAAPDFSPAAHGTDLDTLMARIHGVLPDGTLIEGVEVFRRAYAAIGLGWLVAPTRWPGLRQLCDWAYTVFARNRLRWTGRADACTTDRCEPSQGTPKATAGNAR